MYHTIGRTQEVLGALTPAEVGAQGGTAFDPSTMTLYMGNGKIAVIPALLSALAVKVIMFGGQKVGTMARSKLMAKTATNPGKSSLVPLALVAGGAYLLWRNKQSAPVAGLGAFSFKKMAQMRSIPQSIIKKVVPSKITRQVLTKAGLVKRSSPAPAPAPAPSPAPAKGIQWAPISLVNVKKTPSHRTTWIGKDAKTPEIRWGGVA